MHNRIAQVFQPVQYGIFLHLLAAASCLSKPVLHLLCSMLFLLGERKEKNGKTHERNEEETFSVTPLTWPNMEAPTSSRTARENNCESLSRLDTKERAVQAARTRRDPRATHSQLSGLTELLVCLCAVAEKGTLI